MSTVTPVAISGASGRMGQSLRVCLPEHPELTLGAAVVAADSRYVGEPVGAVGTMLTPAGVRYTSHWRDVGKVGVVIDFSSPDGLEAALTYCLDQRVPLVTGTTGTSAEQQERLRAASASIPVLAAANFSLGVALLRRLVDQAARIVANWDAEIVELHHKRKQDAPSGTALALGQSVAAARGVDLQQQGVFTRHGHTGARQTGQIGFASLRGGDVVGEHSVFLLGEGERLELTHRATDRRIFARGALLAADWLLQQSAGLYGMDDVVRG